MPLFTDEERAVVGTLYKKQGPETALIKGLEYVGPKMAGFVKAARKLAPDRKLIVHCWRGGQRSGSMAWLLRMAGFDVLTIEGGYKAYRRFILDSFVSDLKNIKILGGPTGSGKTDILHALAGMGTQVIDLEGIARHKGSAFGWIGEQEQPSVEQFENDLFEVFRRTSPTLPVWLENESRSIGRVFIPEGLWRQMQAAPLITIEIPIEARIEHLVHVYVQERKSDLVAAFQKIARKLNYRLAIAIEALDRDDYAEAARIALQYYDKTYRHGIESHPGGVAHTCTFDVLDASVIAADIVGLGV
jgi:tRNA 2-selenouridine synthase